MKIGCVCGATIYDNTDLQPNKARLIADQDFDDFREDPGKRFAPLSKVIYQCHDCGRLWLDDPTNGPGDRRLVSFAPDAGPEAERVLGSSQGAAWKAMLWGTWRSDAAGHRPGRLFCAAPTRAAELGRDFERWDDLERAYHTELQTRRAAGALREAPLTRDGTTVHSWQRADPKA